MKNGTRPKKWFYALWRIVVFLCALFFTVSSYIWATNGSWDIAVIFSSIGLIMFIAFFVFGKEIKELYRNKSNEGPDVWL